MLLELKNIEKYYKQNTQKAYVLRDINLEVEKGEFLTIMGPSGAGKSTLLNILGLLESPTAGAYLFQEEHVQSFNERKRTNFHKNHIGFVFQAYHLIDELTVYENIETPLLYKKEIKSKERKSLVAEMLDRFQIVAKKDLFPEQLSGGQQQLVGVARAIVSKPNLLLADEPTGNLHSKQSEEIMRIFQELNREGVTIIQVTHSEKNASYSERVIHLLDGYIEREESGRALAARV